MRLPSLPGVEVKKPADRIVGHALKGEAVRSALIIDSHAHITHEGGRGASRVAMNNSDAQGVVARNRKLGVQKTCVSAWTAIWGDYSMGNEDTLLAMKQFPDEIIGYAALDPNYVKDWDREIRFYHQEHKMVGLKPYYPMMRVPYNDERYMPWYRFGHEHQLFALLHYSDHFSTEVKDIAQRFPDLTFLLAHSGTSWQVARQHVELAKEFDNVVLEITFTSVLEGIIEYMVREIGSERVLYGSDAPMRDPYPQFGWVAYADLRESEKKNIFGRNMERILARCRP